MKKKKPAPVTEATPAPPAKEAAAPQPAPETQTAAPVEGPQPAPSAGGKDVSGVPVETAKPDEKPTEAAAPAPAGRQFQMPAPVTVPIDPIDWFAMRQPFVNRGVFLNDRDGDQIETNWMYFYGNMMRLGFGPDLSAKIANFQTPIYYDLALRADGNLTQIERFDMETEKMLPPGQGLGKITVPVLTPDSLSFMVKQVSGKDINFRF